MVRSFVCAFVFVLSTLFSGCGYDGNETSVPKKRKTEISVSVYRADGKSASEHIVNAVVCPDRSIIAARCGGSIVRITPDGKESVLLSIDDATDWRGLFIDRDNNVFASPHASTAGKGTFSMSDRGLYKLPYGADSMKKVISLYDTGSEDTEETIKNDDTFWSICQDDLGYLYAGVYSHTMRSSPRIYRSVDGGDNWKDLFDFRTLLPKGKHIHSIVFNRYDSCLYCLVGEMNTVLQSSDHGVSWQDLHAQCEEDKGCSMLAVEDGLLIGSDGAYSCTLSKLYRNGLMQTKARIWANTVFAIRRSDRTGWIYAFTKIDSSVNNPDYWPPVSAIDDKDELAKWTATGPAHYSDWLKYYRRCVSIYPEDAVRPQHCSILVSRDDGETWSIIHTEDVGPAGPSGFWTTGYFFDGECLTGFFKRTETMQIERPLIVCEKQAGDVFTITNNDFKYQQ